MQLFIIYKNKIIDKLKGGLPTSVFAWFVILSCTTVMTVALIVFWYFALYSALHDSAINMNSEAIEYERTIDVEQLETTLDLFKKVGKLQ